MNKLLQFARPSVSPATGRPVAPATSYRAVAPAGQAVYTNAYGVPTVAPRVLGIRPAGDAIQDLMDTLAANPNHTLTDADLARITAESGSTPELPSDAPVDSMSLEERRLVEARNSALITAGSAAIGVIGSTITAAIESGNRLQIAQIEATSREAVARYLADAQRAAAGSAAQLQAQQNAANAASIQQLMQRLSGQSSGPSTTTMLLIGGAVLAGVGLLVYMGKGRTRRNPSDRYDNPVMVRDGRRQYFNTRQAPKARRRGWKKAR